MKVLGIEINTMNKLRVILIILSLLSVAVMVYNIERLVNKEATNNDVKPSEVAIYVIMLMVVCLTFLVNLLLYQGALDLNAIDLYFWPDPKYCKIFWLVTYIPIAAAYFYGTANCFYLAAAKNCGECTSIFADRNFIAWGFIYLFGDAIVIACIYFVIKLYSKFWCIVWMKTKK